MSGRGIRCWERLRHSRWVTQRHRRWFRAPARSPAAGGRSQVRLLPFFRFLLLVFLHLGRARAIQFDRHPAEEFT